MKLIRPIRFFVGLAAVGGVLTPQLQAAITEYEGSYEALLISGEGASALPAAKLDVKVSKTGGFSGHLIAGDAKTYPLKGSFTEVDGVAVLVPPKGTTERKLQIVRGKNIPNYVVGFRIDDGVLSAELTTTGLSASANDGVKLKVVVKGGAAADWAGSYSMALSEPEKLSGAASTPTPTGSGYATLIVDAKGGLKYTGKLADGTVLTGSLAPGTARDYRLFTNPYKTANSHLAGFVSFAARESGGFGGSSEMELFWRKSAALKPAKFVAGFGPLGVVARIERWVAPVKGQSLAQLLGMEGKQFSFELLGDSSDLAKLYPGKLPTRLQFDAAGNLLPVFGDVLAPRDAKAWKKIWSAKVNPKTGKFTATLKVLDFVTKAKADGGSSGDRYVSAKVVTRVLNFEGVLLRALDNAEIPFELLGYYELPVVKGFPEALHGGVDGADEIETLGEGGPSVDSIAPGTPGNYRFTIKSEISFDTSQIPTGQNGFSLISQETPPAAIQSGSMVNFTISADLTKLTFNGRVLPLAGDGRIRGETYGGNLVYADTTKPGAKTPNRDNIVVVLFLNGEGVVRDVQVNNIFMLRAKWRIYIPGGTYGGYKIPTINTTASAYGVAVHYYSDLTDPVKVP